jgi:transcriptional regulator GlxA family with amidase domain
MRRRAGAALIVFLAPAGLPAADLAPPPSGKIRVAFAISEGATMIDFAGPWEVFQDVHVEGRGSTMDERMPFELYTVAESREPVRASGGMRIVPDYTFDDAPAPRVIIVPAQRGSERLRAWLVQMRPRVDVLASVCTGAFHLGRAGLLDGKQATTHHDFYDRFAQANPKVTLVRGRRFVEADAVVSTAGGLSSGIDLALHIVQRYYGREAAARTAAYMEYEGKGW